VAKNSSFGVDLKPFSSHEGMIFTAGTSTRGLAAFADCSASLFKVQRTVINRRNHSMAPAIRETVLPVFDNPNEATVERVSAVVHHRDSADEDFSSAIDNTQHKTRTQKGDISKEL